MATKITGPEDSRVSCYVGKKYNRLTARRFIEMRGGGHWGMLGPIFRSKECGAIWRANMAEYMEQRASDFKYKYTPRRYEVPADCDSCDWRCEHRGRQPAFWNYACHSACHWLVDMCLYVAITAYPETPWRIVSSRKHSTVWNGDTLNPMLFDVNFLAIGVSAKEAWSLAVKGRVLKPGSVLRHWVIYK